MSAERNFTTLEEAEFLVRRAQARAEFEALNEEEKAERFAENLPDLWVVRELVSEEWTREDLHPLFLLASEEYRHKRGNVGGYLFILRRRYDWTLTEAAERAGVTELAWVLWETEMKPLSEESLLKVLPRLGLKEVEERALRALQRQHHPTLVHPQEPSLQDLLENRDFSLRYALHRLRKFFGWSFESADLEAYLTPGTWEKWESGWVVPETEELWQALNHLYWVGDWKIEKRHYDFEETDDFDLWYVVFVEKLRRGDRFEMRFPPGPTGLEKARAGDLEVYKAENFQSRAYETRLLSFAHFLRYERESRGMSVETVCDWAEVDVKRWLAWETERALPDQLEVECLAFRLFCSQVKQKEMISAWKSGVMGQAA